MGIFNFFKKKQPNSSEPNDHDSNDLKSLIHNDLELSINNTMLMDNDDLLYDSDKIINNMKKELSKFDFEKYKGYDPINKIELRPEEILFMQYINHKSTTDYNYPLYWHYGYNLNITNTLTRLFEGGYITFGNIEDKLHNLTVAELKVLLKEFKLKVSGRKSELVSRLVEGADHTLLNKKLNTDVFALTNLGKETLKNNEHIMYFHKKNLDISIHEADKVLKEHPGYNHYSIALYILNKRVEIPTSDLAISYLHISYVYKDMGINSKELLYLLIYYCYCMNDFYDFELDFDLMEPPPYVVSQIKKLMVDIGLSMFEISNMITKILSDFNLKPKSKVYDSYINAIK